MENNPYKIIYCVKNNKRNHQYYHYIFLGNIKYSLRTIINKFTNKSLTDTINLLTKKELNELESFYGIKWFKYFFNKEHINYSFSSSNPKLSQLTAKLNIKQFIKKEYKPIFTYGFNIQKNLISSYLKKNKFATYSGGSDEVKNDNITDDNMNSNIENDSDNINDQNKDSNEFDFNFNIDDVIKEAKENEKLEINQTEIDRILNERNNQVVNEFDNIVDDDEIAENNMDKKELNELHRDIRQTEKIVTFKEYRFDKSKDEDEYEDVLYNSFNKVYIYDLYINKDDTIKEIKNKISIAIKNKDIYQNNNIIPSRMYLWIRWLIDEEKEEVKRKTDINKFNSLHYLVSDNKKEEDVNLSNIWIENNNIFHYPIKPYPNINYYINNTKEVQMINEKLNKSTVRIIRNNLDNNILSSMNDYLENNDIFMIDIYNELGYLPRLTEEQILNLQNIFLKIYFPDINPNELKQIIAFVNNGFSDNKNIDAEKEIIKIEQEYNENYLESSLSFKIENIYHEIFTKLNNTSNNALKYTSNNNIIQVHMEIKLISDDLLNFQRLELYKIFDNFPLDNKYVFLQFTQFNNDSIFKFDEKAIDYLIKERDMYVNILKWFNNNEYGIMFRINYNDNYVPANIFIDVMGRLTVKFYWKEEDNISVDDIKDYYYVVKDLIKEINKIIESKIEIPDDNQFRILFMTSLESFKLSNKKEINHNDLSNFSRLFYPYFALVIDPKKRESIIGTNNNYSKYGTYLRYKRINNYENINKIENRIKYYIKYIDLTNKEIVNEIAKQFNLTIQKAQYYFDDVINKYPNIKKSNKRIKAFSEVGKDKMSGIDISIQGKSNDNYKIRLSGVRNIEQMKDINNIINTLLFLYDEIYIKKTTGFKYLLDLLNKIKNIAERRNYVVDFVNHQSNISDIKVMQDNDNIYIGYDIGKGISRHSRLCQNSGKDNRRRPLQFTDDTIGELLKDGYKMNKMTGMYEKQTVYEGKKITLRVVKLKGNNKSSIYYTCTPKHNGRHTFIGFLTKGKNPLGKYPPCCFRTDNFISNNKEKRKFNFNQLKDINDEMKRDKLLTYNEIYYILSDIIKVPNDRLALLPDILDFYLNTNNNHSYKIIQHILASTDNYYFKLGCGDESVIKGKKFMECISKATGQSVDDIIAKSILALNTNQNLFKCLNNGNIAFNFVSINNYVDYLKNGDYLVSDIIDLVSNSGVIDEEGFNIFVLEKTYSNTKFRWDIKVKYLNNENDYSKNRNIFILEQDNTFTLIVNVKKHNKEGVITKIFDNEDLIVKLVKSFINVDKIYLRNTAKDTFKNTKDIIGQDMDNRFRCNYLIHKSGLLIPVVNSGIIDQLEIMDINKFINSYDQTIKLINEFNKLNDKSKSQTISLTINYLIYDKVKDGKYRIRGIGVNDKDLVIPIKKEYIKKSDYKLINQPSYVKLDKMIQNKESRKEIKKDNRVKMINAMKYRNEAYELFRYNLSYFFKDVKNNIYRDKIVDIINNKDIINYANDNTNSNANNKVDMIRKIIYEIINNEKANKFYYNKTKEKIISKNKPLIYVYSKIDLDDYEINNNRYVSDIKNKLQCTSKHELYENGRCMFSLSINLLIEFINKLTYELINNQIRRYEVLRLYGYRVSSIVDDNYFTNKTNEKIIKKKANDIDNPFMTYYQSQNKYIPQTKKVYREKKKSIIKTIKAFKQNGKLNQPVYESNKYLRGIVNCIYYYQNKINLGYYNSLQDVLIDNMIGDIINYVIEKFNYSLGDKINKSNNVNNIEDVYSFVTSISNNSDNINYQLLYQIVSDIYQLNICCYDNNNKVLFTTGKSKQLELLIDDDIVANIYSG